MRFVRLGDCTTKIGSGQTPSGGHRAYSTSGIPLIRSQNVLMGCFTTDGLAFISAQIDEQMRGTRVVRNDVLLNITGASIGRVCVVPDEICPANVNQHVCIIRLNKENEPCFIQPIFSSEKGQNIFTSLQTGSGREGLNFQSIRGMTLSLPTLPEQQKIATFLTAVDEKLQVLKQKKSLLEQYKKGVMQKIFSQELRFKDDNGNEFADWEEKKLGEISRITTGSSNREDSNLDGKFTFFDRSQDIRSSNRFLFDAEAIIIPGEGQEFIPEYFIGKFDLHQRTYAIMDIEPNNGKFLFYYIIFNSNHLNSHAVGSTVKSLRLPMFEKMPIKLASQEEQTKIANFLSAIDEKINQC